MVQTNPVLVFFQPTQLRFYPKSSSRGGVYPLPVVEKNVFFMKSPDICDVWHDFLKRNLTCSSCLLRPSYLGPPISNLTANHSFVVCFVYGNAPGAGHYWNKNPLSASRFFNKTRWQCISWNALRTTVRRECRSPKCTAITWNALYTVVRREFRFPKCTAIKWNILLYNVMSKYGKTI